MPKSQQKNSNQPAFESQEETCSKCEEKLYKSQSVIVCSTCALKFHIQCQNISQTKFDALSKEEDDSLLWFCASCRRVTRNMINKMAAMEQRLGIIESDLKSTNQSMQSVQKLCKSLQEKNSHLEAETTKLKKRIEAEEDKSEVQCRVMEGLRRDLYTEHFKNSSLEQKLDTLEQSLKQNNIRIVSMPESDEGNLTTQVLELLNLPDITEQDIESSYRLGKSKPGKTQKTRDVTYF